MCWMAAAWSRYLGFIGVRVMRELVLDFNGPELGTEQRFWQAADLCVCAYLCVCVVCRITVSIERSEAAKPSMTHLHMGWVNYSKMVGLHRVSLSLSVCLSVFLLLARSFCPRTHPIGEWERWVHCNLNPSRPIWLVM